MSREMEEVWRCDKCGNSPDGDTIDSITALKCGHDICSRCQGSLRNKHPEVKHPQAWCPKCDKAVDGPFA